MKQRLLRLTAMLMFGCMLVSSIPAGVAQAEDAVQNGELVEATEDASRWNAGFR